MKAKLALAVIALAASANTAIAQDNTSQTGLTTTQSGMSVRQDTTISAQQYLNSLAVKFGVGVDRLNSMLGRLPPRGEGLSILEISVIASKLHLNKDDKAALKAKVGKGGTGLTTSDIAMMGSSLGLDNPQIAALSTQLGLPNPFVSATPSGTMEPTAVNYTTTPESTIPSAAPASTTPGAAEVYPPGMQVVP